MLPWSIVRILFDHQSVTVLPAHSHLAVAVMLDDVIEFCPLVDTQVDEDAAIAHICPVTWRQEVISTLQLARGSQLPTRRATAVDHETAQG